MAIKDWKKTKDEYHDDVWLSKNMGLRISKSSKQYFVERWEINEDHWGRSYPHVFFKTKSQAIKYAKAYMRTH